MPIADNRVTTSAKFTVDMDASGRRSLNKIRPYFGI